MTTDLSRRAMLAAGVAAALPSLGAAQQPAPPAAGPQSQPVAPPAPPGAPFRYCFNTSTIRGQKLPLAQIVEIVARAGYQGIEPWLNEIDAHVAQGGTLADLGKRIADLGLTVEGAIGFDRWIVNDDAERNAALDSLRRNMDKVRALGGRRIAAPPSGATDRADVPLATIAQRYRDILNLGQKHEVLPQLELWGFSKTLGKLSELLYVAAESRHPQANLLCDVYHLYKGGSDFAGLRLVAGGAMDVLHMNDYPDQPPREQIADRHRVYPGDGVAPLRQILRDLAAAGYRGALSLELFNADYYMQDPLNVALTGLRKMQNVVAAALEG